MKLGPFEFSYTSKRPERGRSLRRKAQEFGEHGGIEYLGDLILQIEALQGTSSNRYLTREMQVDETIRKYRGQAAKGNILLRNILEARTAWTIGKGLNHTGWVGEAETGFIKEFFAVNRFNMAYLRRLGRERCFEGQVLLVLNPGEDHIPRIRFVSWYDTRYEVVSDPLDYGYFKYVRWLGDAQLDYDVDAGRTAFMKFHTRMNSNVGTPLFAGILGQLEDLDDAIICFKTINSKASKPTPCFEFNTEDDASSFQERLKTLNWKAGDPLAVGGKPSMLQIGYGPYSANSELITILVKIISGHTSVPPHYFGFPDLLNNRATADDISRMFVAISETETDEWGSGFTDLVGRAMAMYNRETGSRLQATAGRVEVEVVSFEAWNHIATVWLPAWREGAITDEEFLKKLPGVDEKTEAGRARQQRREEGIARGARGGQGSGAGGRTDPELSGGSEGTQIM